MEVDMKKRVIIRVITFFITICVLIVGKINVRALYSLEGEYVLRVASILSDGRLKTNCSISGRTILCDVAGEESFVLYSFNPCGYIIFDISVTTVLEAAFCENSKSPFPEIIDANTQLCYGGPGNYYYLSNNTLRDINSNRVLTEYEIESIAEGTRKVSEYVNTNAYRIEEPSRVGVLTTMIESDYFISLTNQFGNNVSGTCTTVATCILLGYYDEFVDDDFVSYLFRNGIGTTQGFHDYMAYNYIDPDYNGAYITDAAIGMNDYFSVIGIDAESFAVTGPYPTGPNNTVSTVLTSVQNGYPLIANMNQNVLGAPYNHSVVVYGVAINSYNPVETQTCFIVHMGWQNSSVANRQLYCSSLWFWDSAYIVFDGENEI